MYAPSNNQERQHKDFFYPKETMGTTIIAVKYDGGVIACADSSNNLNMQEPLLEESTLSIELQTKSTTYMNISWHWEADSQANHNKLSTKWDIWLIPMLTNKESCHTLKPLPECCKKQITKRVLRLDILLPVGIPMMDLKYTVLTWEEQLY